MGPGSNIRTLAGWNIITRVPDYRLDGTGDKVILVTRWSVRCPNRMARFRKEDSILPAFIMQVLMTYVACLGGFLRTVPRARQELEATFVQAILPSSWSFVDGQMPVTLIPSFILIFRSGTPLA